MIKQEPTDIENMLSALFNVCLEQSTGTFFVATEDNKSCQIVIERGVLTMSSFGQDKGLAALIEFKALKTGRFSFSSNLVLPMDESATIQHSPEALEFLGYEKYQQALRTPAVEPESEVAEPVPEMATRTERRIVRMYRGQPIYEEVEVTKPLSGAPDNNIDRNIQSNKPARMYRGRVVNS